MKGYDNKGVVVNYNGKLVQFSVDPENPQKAEF